VESLSRYVREERHESRALHRKGEFALVRRRDVRALLALDAGMGIQELLEDVRILIVDVLYVVLFEETLLAHND
jgi:hypothetical protein